MLAQPHAGHGVEGAIVAVGRIGGEQPLGLLLRRLVQVALDEHLDVLEARGVVVRRKFEHAFQQQLRVIEDVTLDADARQQAHRLHVVAVLQQEGADQLLRGRELAVREQRRRGDHLRGQLLERGDVRRGRRGVLGSPVRRYRPSSMPQLAGRAWLMFTARRKASMASGAWRSTTWQWPRSW